ncbi:glycosyltransferase family 2 protein [Bacillus sp. CGMCC 1.16541]|uniref:glycosyltransferase n=1 Tax=Bacillus sp. CGMCC 1.16541 TaxID=2185143 RepID=UPI000D7342ED|nr:glycosyltransferase family 2 protein [Bacillus sp. CGMCC 1.16541]
MSVYITIFLMLFLGTIINITLLPTLKKKAKKERESYPLISVLIPMRNEERNVKRVMQAIKSLTYPNIECIILDDQSTDRTRDYLEEEMRGHQPFKVIDGKPLPTGWVGKVHACHQLSTHAKGDYLLFIDADVSLKHDTLEQALALSEKRKSSLLTGFSRFPVKHFLESLIVPMQHVVVFSYLPVILANYTNYPSATAAHGAFMFFKREDYDQVGGHQVVQSSLIEDVHIAQEFKRQGLKVVLANITSHVSCFMYESDEEVWNGFAKNIYTGLGRSVPSLLALSLFFIMYYIFPVPLFIYGLVAGNGFALVPLALVIAQRLIIDVAARQKWYLCVTMPLAALALIVLMQHSMWKGVQKIGYEWKGRHYQ